MPPHQALQFLVSQQGLAKGMQFEEINPREELAQQIRQVYTLGTVTVEDFLYTCDTRGGRAKGYTLGITFGSRLGINWSFRHLTVVALADQFDAYAPTFVAMLDSCRIDEQWVKDYVHRGMVRLRQLQRQTREVVARNAGEIREMMQAAYEERQQSQDYTDSQRANYIRGQQDWVSAVEGGTVYHTDSWGTKNTATGQSWEGQPYDYVHFGGKNPQYNETMTPIDSRQLWEQHIQ